VVRYQAALRPVINFSLDLIGLTIVAYREIVAKLSDEKSKKSVNRILVAIASTKIPPTYYKEAAFFIFGF
jgi:hypothetical protein